MNALAGLLKAYAQAKTDICAKLCIPDDRDPVQWVYTMCKELEERRTETPNEAWMRAFSASIRKPSPTEAEQ